MSFIAYPSTYTGVISDFAYAIDADIGTRAYISALANDSVLVDGFPAMDLSNYYSVWVVITHNATSYTDDEVQVSVEGGGSSYILYPWQTPLNTDGKMEMYAEVPVSDISGSDLSSLTIHIDGVVNKGTDGDAVLHLYNIMVEGCELSISASSQTQTGGTSLSDSAYSYDQDLSSSSYWNMGTVEVPIYSTFTFGSQPVDPDTMMLRLRLHAYLRGTTNNFTIKAVNTATLDEEVLATYTVLFNGAYLYSIPASLHIVDASDLEIIYESTRTGGVTGSRAYTYDIRLCYEEFTGAPVTVSPAQANVNILVPSPFVDYGQKTVIIDESISLTIELKDAIIPFVTVSVDAQNISISFPSVLVLIGYTQPPSAAHVLDILGDGSCKHLWHFDNHDIVDVGNGTITTPGAHTYPIGKYGSAVRTTTKSLTDFSDMDATNGLTYTFYAYLDPTITKYTRFGMFGEGDGYNQLYLEDWEDENLYLKWRSDEIYFNNANVVYGTWMHFAIVQWADNTTKVYVNNVNNIYTDFGTIVPSQSMSLQANSDKVLMDSIRMFNKALTETEIDIVMSEDSPFVTIEIDIVLVLNIAILSFSVVTEETGGINIYTLEVFINVSLFDPFVFSLDSTAGFFENFILSQEVQCITAKREFLILQEITRSPDQSPEAIIIKRIRN